MNFKLTPPRRAVLSLGVTTLLLMGCNVSISDPIEEAPAPVAPATPTMVVAARATTPARAQTPDAEVAIEPESSPTPEPTPSPTVAPRLYTVVQGDTLGIIAIRFKVPVESLLAANQMANGDALQVGQVLIIPSASQVVAVEQAAGTPVPTVIAADGNPIYYVKVGDTLSSIAEAQGVARDDLMAANGLRPDSQLTAGDTLIIPKGAYTPVATATALAATAVPTVVVAAAPSIVAPTEAPVAAAATSAPSTHTVAAGETAGVIARDHSLSVPALAAANPGVNLDKLQIGQTLTIPSSEGATAAPSLAAAPAASATVALPTATPSITPTPLPTVLVTHVVTEGETVESVAGKYGTSVEIIKKNNSDLAGDLTPEAVIRVPVTVTMTPTPARTPSPTPTALVMKYQTPQLLAPADGGVWIHQADKSPPMLLWTAVGLLEKNEFYVVRLRALDTEGNLLWSRSYWTQDTNWRLEESLISTIQGRVLLRWDVMVMRRTSAEGLEPVVGDPLSGKSDSYTIRFTPAGN